MPNKKNYPKDFSPYFEPYYYPRLPEKEIETKKEIKKESICHGDVIERIDENTIKVIETDYGYDNDIELNIVTYHIDKKPNPAYNQAAIKKEKKRKEEHKKQLAEWKQMKAKWDAEAALESEEAEKKLLNRLKKKYEQRN